MPIGSYDELKGLLAESRLVVVEGATRSGRKELVDRLAEDLSMRTYRYLNPRERWSGRPLPDGLSVEQSTLWVMDFMNQHDDMRVVCDRSMASSIYFENQESADELLEMWSGGIKSLGGYVVLVEPPMSDHRRRLAELQESHLLNSVTMERRSLREVLDLFEPGLVLNFSGLEFF
jgi:thymidylate kinase